MMRKIGLLAIVLISSFGFGTPAYSLSLSELLANTIERGQFKIVHIQELAVMTAKPTRSVIVFDANPPDVRASEGIVPGARPLSSAGHYDVARELPAPKDTPLVFYCHNS